MSEIISLVTTYDFIWRAFAAGFMVALCASLLGVSLVLKRLSMIGDGLSHISFGSVAAATVLGIAPLRLAIPVAAVCAVILFNISGKKMKGDSAIAVISSGALAIGIIMISYYGSSADMNNYLIGSLYSVTGSDLWVTFVLFLSVILCFVLFYNRIFSVTFDEDFSKATGGRPSLVLMMLAVLTSAAVVIGMRVMGALLMSALIVFPALSAMRVFKSFLSVTLCAAVISAICFVIGFALTLVLDDVPTGACITAVNLCVFALMSFVSRHR